MIQRNSTLWPMAKCVQLSRLKKINVTFQNRLYRKKQCSRNGDMRAPSICCLGLYIIHRAAYLTLECPATVRLVPALLQDKLLVDSDYLMCETLWNICLLIIQWPYPLCNSFVTITHLPFFLFKKSFSVYSQVDISESVFWQFPTYFPCSSRSL